MHFVLLVTNSWWLDGERFAAAAALGRPFVLIETGRDRRGERVSSTVCVCSGRPGMGFIPASAEWFRFGGWVERGIPEGGIDYRLLPYLRTLPCGDEDVADCVSSRLRGDDALSAICGGILNDDLLIRARYDRQPSALNHNTNFSIKQRQVRQWHVGRYDMIWYLVSQKKRRKGKGKAKKYKTKKKNVRQTDRRKQTRKTKKPGINQAGVDEKPISPSKPKPLTPFSVLFVSRSPLRGWSKYILQPCFPSSSPQTITKPIHNQPK